MCKNLSKLISAKILWSFKVPGPALHSQLTWAAGEHLVCAVDPQTLGRLIMVEGGDVVWSTTGFVGCSSLWQVIGWLACQRWLVGGNCLGWMFVGHVCPGLPKRSTQTSPRTATYKAE